MSLYYLMAQLPSLDGLSIGSTPPISESKFLEICEDNLDTKSLSMLKGITLIPDRSSKDNSDNLIGKWEKAEISLRKSLSDLRAEGLGKDMGGEKRATALSVENLAKSLLEQENPLKAEAMLCEYRLSLLEALRPLDNFCDDSLFYYAIKLKLLSRQAGFDTKKGQEAYQSIYNSVLNGERQAEKHNG